jgi:hypothetical protein
MNETNPKPATRLNTWKIVGALAVMALILAIFALGPSLTGPPDPGPPDGPSMKNIPPPGSKQLTIEVNPESTEGDGEQAGE